MRTPIVYIMAGGSGTRLKPLSQNDEGKLPKQFLSLTGGNTLLQEALLRIPQAYTPAVIPEKRYSAEVRSQADAAGAGNMEILEEPFGCNTAAAVLYAALFEALSRQDPDRIICFIPADHRMDKDIFQKLLKDAVRLAGEHEKIITIGIKPSRPETGYGYIKTQENASAAEKIGFPVESFVEKPDLQTARKYLQSGDYYWNAGMFIGKAGLFLKYAQKHCPAILDILKEFVNEDTDSENADTDLADTYQKLKDQGLAISIDYALMEKISQNMLLVPAPQELAWNDLGSWESLKPYMQQTDAGDCLWLGDSSPTFQESSDSMVFNYTSLPVTMKGCEGLVVVVTENGVLVRRKEA